MESLLDKFKNNKYIFHIHTNYTDGKNSVDDYCKYAVENGYKNIAFLEHIRKNPKYDFMKFVNDINSAKMKYPMLNIFLGIEAKILPDGSLDYPEDIFSFIDIIGIAEHGFPFDLELYKNVLKNIFRNDIYKKKPRVWVHPGLFLKKHNLFSEYNELYKFFLSYAIENNIYIEYNKKYSLPSKSYLSLIPENFIINGLDAHNINEIRGIL